MRALAWVLLLLASVACAVEPPEPVEIEILSPEQDAQVGPQELVRGTASGATANLCVLVRPLETNLWWVQRPPSPPNGDGSWRSVAYFGSEAEGGGELFELVAIVTSKPCEEGQTLEEIPKSAARSDIVTVRRTE